MASSQTFSCPLCEQRVPRAELVPHMDACRDARVTALALALGIADERVVALFRPAIHDASRHALGAAPDEAGSEALIAAANAAGGHPSFAVHAAFSASDGASPAEHAIVMLPRGPAYMMNDADAHEILPGLWLGSEAAARGAGFLRARGIRAVVNCAIDSEPLAEEERRAAGVDFFRWIRIVDLPGADNRRGIDEGLAALAEAVAHVAPAEAAASAAAASAAAGAAVRGATSASGGGVLVHCIAGVSRSATIVIAHLVAARGMSLLDAAGLVKAKRKVVLPNRGFFAELVALERELRGESSLPANALELHKSTPMTAVRVKNSGAVLGGSAR
jgi:hypothetical protein